MEWPSRMWCVQVVQPWSSLELEIAPNLPIVNCQAGMIGFLPIFDTREEAVEFMNGDETHVAEIRPAQKGGE